MSLTAKVNAHEQIITNLLKELQRNPAVGPAVIDTVMEASKEIFDPQARTGDETVKIIQAIWDDVQAER